MKLKFITLYLIFCIVASSAVAQDSSIMLPLSTFIETVRNNHPGARQAGIVVKKAEADLLSAQGAFDPSANLNASRKTFDGKNYYFYSNPELKVPLPVGDVKAGLENNGGQYLTTEETAGSTSYLGIELPLAKGLITDKRRTALQQARLYNGMSAQEKLVMINNLLLDAYLAYYNWAAAFKLYHVYGQYVNVNEKRLRLIKTGQANGDRSAMDTAEAYTQLQNFLIMQSEALIRLNAARFEMDNFIWGSNKQPQNIADGVYPDTSELQKPFVIVSLTGLLQTNEQQNPQLLQYKFKIDALLAEKKLKFQSMLPAVNLKANLLSKDYYVLKNFSGATLQNNYKWGIDIKIPLLLREGRGEFAKAKLKVEETNLDLQQKTLETQNKIKDYHSQYTLLQTQLQNANSALLNYNGLLRNELLRFENGESSLFIVNSRENKVLEMQQKLIELQLKSMKVKYTMEWVAGQLK